ncbi:rhodanese-like domain-containing protein [Coraliomargarita algicola]|uniref:Rhodanese-like domain-containing protein n=1 Tax=Coraliomargarita algicola TaxID=3092156 RepID=A0ABZ0REW2_9BACT|nr:rhodanese-like domain-containing protein [Coraliomargarita sp. J2-16]WPJ94038.1 rhodanese-like domain-containing protein [Coraliomargarita sp. J2-16]
MKIEALNSACSLHRHTMPSLFKEFLIIIALTLIGSAYSLVHELAPRPWAEPTLAAGEIQLADAQAMNVIWLDARPIAAFEAAHIPDALFFDEGDWDSGLMTLMDAWLTQPRPIVVYCGSESCGTSQRVAERLRTALPDAEIYSLKGGWDAWQQ